MEMLNFKPERIGHGVCIHPLFGGTKISWELLCKSQIPVGKPFICVSFKRLYERSPDSGRGGARRRDAIAELLTRN